MGEVAGAGAVGATAGPIRSVSEALNAVGFGRWQTLLLFYTGCAMIADACEGILMSFLGPAAACDWGLSSGEESLLQSVAFIGSMVGLYVLGAMADTWGRRIGFCASAVLLGAFGLASAGAPNYGSLIFFRLVCGFAIAGAPITITLFAEQVPSNSRARWSLLMQLFWTLGSILEAGLAWAIVPTLGWRWLVGISAVPACTLLLFFPLLPESPFWLNERKRHAEAEAVMARMARVNRYPGRHEMRLCFDPAAIPGDAEVASEKQQPAAGTPSSELSADADAPAGGSDGERGCGQRARSGLKATGGLLAEAWRAIVHCMEVIFSRRLAWTTALLTVIWFANAMAYTGFIVLTPNIGSNDQAAQCLESGEVNWTNSDFVTTLVTAAAELPGYLLAIVLVDWIGRRWTMRLLAGACTVAATLLAVRSWSYGWQLAILMLARASIGGAFGTQYIYTPELYPTSARSNALAFVDSIGRLGGFAAPYAIVPFINSNAIKSAAAVLAGVSGAGLLACLLLPQETMGRTLSKAGRHESLGRALSRSARGALSTKVSGTGRLHATSRSASLRGCVSPGLLEGIEEEPLGAASDVSLVGKAATPDAAAAQANGKGVAGEQ